MFVVGTIEGRFIALRCAGTRGKPVPAVGATPDTNKAKVGGSTIAIVPAIIEVESGSASSHA